MPASARPSPPLPATTPSRKRRSKTPPNPIDVHVGARLRLRRMLLGLSQDKLGEAIGLTFQQVQKYERGANRIGASRLYDLSQILDVPVAFFYDDMPEAIAAAAARPPSGVQPVPQAAPGQMDRPETKELIKAYYGIANRRLRRYLFGMTKVLAATD